MSRYELGMALNYASNWGIVDAVREFFQNATDAEIEDPENKMFFTYDAEKELLAIGNLKSKLTPASLLMGSSSKIGQGATVGEHGEGYKVATVVLMRNGITVSMYNNEASEVWTSKIVNSRRYGTEVVVFDIKKEFFNKENNLVIELKGITESMWEAIVDSNLSLQEIVNCGIGGTKESVNGRVLLEPAYKGKIYVNGMYVCTKEQLAMGYDFKPGVLKLDRDRQCLDSIDVCTESSKLLAGVHDAEFLMSVKNTPDAKFSWIYINTPVPKESEPDIKETEEFVQEVSDRVYDSLKEEYGEDVVPVIDYTEFNCKKQQGVNVALVPYQDYKLVNLVERYFEAKGEKSPDELFQEWLDAAESQLDAKLWNEIQYIWSLK